MRILHLVSYSLFSGPLPPTTGLALAQRRLGHDVWLAYDTKRGAFNDYEEPAAPRLAGTGLDPPLRLTLSAKSSVVELWRDVVGLRRMCAAGGADVVHVHLSHDHLLAALARLRRGPPLCVRTVHAERTLARRLGQAWLHRRCDAWVTRARIHGDQLRERFGVAADRVAVIPSGFDAAGLPPPTAAERAEARRRFGIPATAFTVVQVALVSDRGQRELVSALARAPEQERPVALFVGRGEGEPALRRHVQELGMEGWVRFAGYLQGPALRRGYAAADAAFLAQPGNDGSARAALEAMAARVPLVAVTTGALGELVTEGRGFAVPSRDPAAILQALRESRSRPDETARRVDAAYSHVVTERTFEREARATLELYDRVIRQRRAATGGDA